jgi:hypothetical protein
MISIGVTSLFLMGAHILVPLVMEKTAIPSRPIDFLHWNLHSLLESFNSTAPSLCS